MAAIGNIPPGYDSRIQAIPQTQFFDPRFVRGIYRRSKEVHNTEQKALNPQHEHTMKLAHLVAAGILAILSVLAFTVLSATGVGACAAGLALVMLAIAYHHHQRQQALIRDREEIVNVCEGAAEQFIGRDLHMNSLGLDPEQQVQERARRAPYIPRPTGAQPEVLAW